MAGLAWKAGRVATVAEGCPPLQACPTLERWRGGSHGKNAPYKWFFIVKHIMQICHKEYCVLKNGSGNLKNHHVNKMNT